MLKRKGERRTAFTREFILDPFYIEGRSWKKPKSNFGKKGFKTKHKRHGDGKDMCRPTKDGKRGEQSQNKRKESRQDGRRLSIERKKRERKMEKTGRHKTGKKSEKEYLEMKQ